ncbi:MAG: glycosyltransferase [Rickettsiales bacterium]|jgi:glycosyltransferase involved in cell wall biosynthesis|nr:glycosyltransferase [Rickettsiales bacterium]
MKKVILVSDNPLSRSVAPLAKSLSVMGVAVDSLRTGDKITDKNAIVHCFGLRAAQATHRLKNPRVITLSEEPDNHFMAKWRQKSWIRGAKLIATSKFIGNGWGIKSVIRTGLNLAIFNPDAIPARRQTDIFQKYNIPHDRKMIVALGPVKDSLPDIIDMAEDLDRQDFIIAMVGELSPASGKKLTKDARKAGLGDKIIFIGVEPDMPSLLRSAFFVLSLYDHKYMPAALSLGTPVIAMKRGLAPEIPTNWEIDPDDVEEFRDAFSAALDLSTGEKSQIAMDNAKFAKKFLDINKTASEYIELYSKL